MTDDAEWFGKGSVRASAQRLDHPLTLGISGIGCDIVSEGASAHGDVSRLTPGIVAWAAELTPGTNACEHVPPRDPNYA